MLKPLPGTFDYFIFKKMLTDEVISQKINISLEEIQQRREYYKTHDVRFCKHCLRLFEPTREEPGPQWLRVHCSKACRKFHAQQTKTVNDQSVNYMADWFNEADLESKTRQKMTLQISHQVELQQ